MKKTKKGSIVAHYYVLLCKLNCCKLDTFCLYRLFVCLISLCDSKMHERIRKTMKNWTIKLGREKKHVNITSCKNASTIMFLHSEKSKQARDKEQNKPRTSKNNNNQGKKVNTHTLRIYNKYHFVSAFCRWKFILSNISLTFSSVICDLSSGCVFF